MQVVPPPLHQYLAHHVVAHQQSSNPQHHHLQQQPLLPVPRGKAMLKVNMMRRMRSTYEFRNEFQEVLAELLAGNNAGNQNHHQSPGAGTGAKSSFFHPSTRSLGAAGTPGGGGSSSSYQANHKQVFRMKKKSMSNHDITADHGDRGGPFRTLNLEDNDSASEQRTSIQSSLTAFYHSQGPPAFVLNPWSATSMLPPSTANDFGGTGTGTSTGLLLTIYRDNLYGAYVVFLGFFWVVVFQFLFAMFLYLRRRSCKSICISTSSCGVSHGRTTTQAAAKSAGALGDRPRTSGPVVGKSTRGSFKSSSTNIVYGAGQSGASSPSYLEQQWALLRQLQICVMEVLFCNHDYGTWIKTNRKGKEPGTRAPARDDIESRVDDAESCDPEMSSEHQDYTSRVRRGPRWPGNMEQETIFEDEEFFDNELSDTQSHDEGDDMFLHSGYNSSSSCHHPNSHYGNLLHDDSSAHNRMRRRQGSYNYAPADHNFARSYSYSSYGQKKPHSLSRQSTSSIVSTKVKSCFFVDKVERLVRKCGKRLHSLVLDFLVSSGGKMSTSSSASSSSLSSRRKLLRNTTSIRQQLQIRFEEFELSLRVLQTITTGLVVLQIFFGAFQLTWVALIHITLELLWVFWVAGKYVEITEGGTGEVEEENTTSIGTRYYGKQTYRGRAYSAALPIFDTPRKKGSRVLQPEKQNQMPQSSSYAIHATSGARPSFALRRAHTTPAGSASAASSHAGSSPAESDPISNSQRQHLDNLIQHDDARLLCSIPEYTVGGGPGFISPDKQEQGQELLSSSEDQDPDHAGLSSCDDEEHQQQRYQRRNPNQTRNGNSTALSMQLHHFVPNLHGAPLQHGGAFFLAPPHDQMNSHFRFAHGHDPAPSLRPSAAFYQRQGTTPLLDQEEVDYYPAALPSSAYGRSPGGGTRKMKSSPLDPRRDNFSDQARQHPSSVFFYPSNIHNTDGRGPGQQNRETETALLVREAENHNDNLRRMAMNTTDLILVQMNQHCSPFVEKSSASRLGRHRQGPENKTTTEDHHGRCVVDHNNPFSALESRVLQHAQEWSSSSADDLTNESSSKEEFGSFETQGDENEECDDHRKNYATAAGRGRPDGASTTSTSQREEDLDVEGGGVKQIISLTSSNETMSRRRAASLRRRSSGDGKDDVPSLIDLVSSEEFVHRGLQNSRNCDHISVSPASGPSSRSVVSICSLVQRPDELSTDRRDHPKSSSHRVDERQLSSAATKRLLGQMQQSTDDNRQVYSIALHDTRSHILSSPPTAVLAGSASADLVASTSLETRKEDGVSAAYTRTTHGGPTRTSQRLPSGSAAARTWHPIPFVAPPGSEEDSACSADQLALQLYPAAPSARRGTSTWKATGSCDDIHDHAVVDEGVPVAFSGRKHHTARYNYTRERSASLPSPELQQQDETGGDFLTITHGGALTRKVEDDRIDDTIKNKVKVEDQSLISIRPDTQDPRPKTETGASMRNCARTSSGRKSELGGSNRTTGVTTRFSKNELRKLECFVCRLWIFTCIGVFALLWLFFKCC
ncbi:unnamed protein product [Amoebophrya sp. A120]|nr:unnamed protein product [Amoebophrya sp. A120]|eukprot:GSA120T00019328001.1